MTDLVQVLAVGLIQVEGCEQVSAVYGLVEAGALVRGEAASRLLDQDRFGCALVDTVARLAIHRGVQAVLRLGRPR